MCLMKDGLDGVSCFFREAGTVTEGDDLEDSSLDFGEKPVHLHQDYHTTPRAKPFSGDIVLANRHLSFPEMEATVQ